MPPFFPLSADSGVCILNAMSSSARDWEPPSPEEFQALHPAAQLHLFESGHELTDVLEPMWRLTAEFLGLANHC